MPKPLSQSELILEATREYNRLTAFLQEVPLEKWDLPGALGRWSVREVLAHLIAWHDLYRCWQAAGERGELPPIPAEGYNWAQLPALNEKLRQDWAGIAAEDMTRRLHASHGEILAGVESLAEEDLLRRGVPAWTGKHNLLSYLNSITAAHYRWSFTEMRRNLRKGTF